jgi:soluble lytic murein transglycosylase-like protein
MPRDITVTFADGQTHTYKNAPDDITPEQVSERAQREFGQPVTALDGGRGSPPPSRARGAAPAQAPAQAPRRTGTLEARGIALPRFNQRQQQAPTPIPEPVRRLSRSQAQDHLTRGENRLREVTANMPRRTRRQAYTNFYANPLIRAYRQQAGLPEVRTQDEEIRTAARRTADRNAQDITRGVSAVRTFTRPIEAVVGGPLSLASSDEDVGNVLTSLNAGIRRGLFGLPERLSAGLEYMTGDSGQSYDNILQVQRAITDAELDKSLLGNIAGQGATAVLSGGAIANSVRQGGTRLAASQAPRAQRAGNLLQDAVTLRRGETAANTAKLMGAGGLAGGAQAAGEGSDVATGTVIGMAAPAALSTLGKTLQVGGGVVRAATRPFSNNVERAVREVVTESPAAIRARQADLSRRTGSNVSLIAALSEGDFGTVVNRILRQSPEALEVGRRHTTDYMRNFMQRMTGHVNQAGRSANAMQASIGDLAQIRKDTADDLMKDIADDTVDLAQVPLDDLERSLTREIGSRDRNLSQRINEAFADIDPKTLGDEFGDMTPADFAAAKKMLDDWGLGTPVTATVREMDNLRRALDAAAKSTRTSQPANSLAYRNAARVIRDYVEKEVPAYGQMVDTFAAQSRVMEGFETAARGSRVSETVDDTLRANLQTPEGRLGMQAGELFRLREAAGNRTSSAVGLARDLAAGGRLTRPASTEPGAPLPGTVTENLGDQASRGLREAAEGEYAVLERMLRAGRVDLSKLAEDAIDNPGTVAYGATLVGGNAQAQTVARFVANLIRKSGAGQFNQRTASNVADMLFSNDPAKTAQALRALERAGMGERAVAAMIGQSIPGAAALGQVASGAAVEDAAPEPQRSRVQTDVSIPEAEDPAMLEGQDLGGQALPDEGNLEGLANPGGYIPERAIPNPESQYSGALQEIYSAESPELLSLIERVAHQESRGQHFDANGRPTTSRAGAIGIMQVMPGTAPEAARMAGVEYDEQAYRNDPTYNKLIGIAYLRSMLMRYDGDVAKALAAYNAGPGRVDREVRRDPRNWLASMPAETRDYVEKIY